MSMTTPTTSRVSDIPASDLVFEAWPPDPGGMRVYAPRGVKVTHTPTGFTCACSHERSGHANRDTALRALHAALASQGDVVAVSELRALTKYFAYWDGEVGETNTPDEDLKCGDENKERVFIRYTDLSAILNRGGK